MSVASSQQSFLANAIIPQTHKLKTNFFTSPNIISCKRSSSSERPFQVLVYSKKNENPFAKLAMVTLAAGVLTMGSVHDASAAKSGGRVGGQAFRSAAPRPSSPRINNNSRTNIYINPPVAPPLVGGYGYGYGSPFYGGWGWSTFSFFASGPSVAIGIGGSFQLLAVAMFLGAIATVTRRFNASRDEEADDYY